MRQANTSTDARYTRYLPSGLTTEFLIFCCYCCCTYCFLFSCRRSVRAIELSMYHDLKKTWIPNQPRSAVPQQWGGVVLKVLAQQSQPDLTKVQKVHAQSQAKSRAKRRKRSEYQTFGWRKQLNVIIVQIFFFPERQWWTLQILPSGRLSSKLMKYVFTDRCVVGVRDIC